MRSRGSWFLGGCSVVVVIYSIFVLGYVATSPDIGLRCLMTDEASETTDVTRGVVIREIPSADSIKGAYPKKGDLLVRINESPIRTFMDFTRQVAALRDAPVPTGGTYYDVGFDPSELKKPKMLPALVEDKEFHRFVEIEWIEQGTGEHRTCYLAVSSLPTGSVTFSLIWFVLQFGIFAVSALVFWHRPNDRPSRLFFALCMVTLGAFIGTNHWWIIAGSFGLAAPCILCAMILPVVALHFFLVFPKPWTQLTVRPAWSLALLYSLPVASIVMMLSLLSWCGWLNWGEPSSEQIGATRQALGWIRNGIYAYLLVASTYFVIALAVVWSSLRRAQNLLEYNQLRLLWFAGLAASVCMVWTLFLAAFDHERFALGGARIAIFLAAFCFTLAYTVGIVRFKLMLVDQIISKGMLYYVFSSALTAAVCLAVVLIVLLPQQWNISLRSQQAVTSALVLMLVVAILLWMRDLFQQMIDRKFFREKYQLDKALQRMNRAVGSLMSPESLAEMMLVSCRDVLNVERAALYIRTSAEGSFQLVAALGSQNIPIQFEPSAEFLAALRQAGSLQRVTAGTRSELSPVQNVLLELRADLVHALEVDSGVVGLVLLGGHKSASAFSAEDLTFLNALGQITNVALHSAKVDQNVTRLNEELRLKVERIATQQRQIAALQSELTRSQQEAAPVAGLPQDFQRGEIKGTSRALERVLDTVQKVASSESTVLIRGESGTGKELLAQVLHDNSPRRDGPMIKVHCAALSPGLLESELFGHVKGAFTGAHRDKIGRFEAAHGGTLFLDEIGDISAETQVKLLRVLQERCFEPVGGSETVEVDVRLITATHQNLEKLIAAGRFREDLYYRLNVITLALPALRERPEDILELAIHFLNRSATKIGRRITHIEDEALLALERYHWPGNVRELENVIERAVVLSEQDRLTLRDFPPEISRGVSKLPRHVIEAKPLAISSTSIVPLERGLSRGDTPEAVQSHNQIAVVNFHNGRGFEQGDLSADERDMLVNALEQCDGNKARAARLLGMPRSTFFSKLKKHGVG